MDGFGKAVELFPDDQLGGRGFFDAAETLDGSLEIGAVFDLGEELGEAGVGRNADVNGAVVELQKIPKSHGEGHAVGVAIEGDHESGERIGRFAPFAGLLQNGVIFGDAFDEVSFAQAGKGVVANEKAFVLVASIVIDDGDAKVFVGGEVGHFDGLKDDAFAHLTKAEDDQMRLARIVFFGDRGGVVEVVSAEKEAGGIFENVEYGDVSGVLRSGEKFLLANEFAKTGVDDVDEGGGFFWPGIG